MKKFFLFLGILFVLFLAALMIIPTLFRDDIIAWVKRDINKDFTAAVDFEDLHLSLLRSFPYLNVSLEGLRIINREPFAGDTLADIPVIRATLNLRSLWGDGPPEVHSVQVENPRVWLKALKDGSVNWDILRKQAPDTAQAASESGGLYLALDSYEISNARVHYNDAGSGNLLTLEGLNHRGSGNFDVDQFVLSTETEIANVRFLQDGTSLVNHAALTATIDLDIDQKAGKYTFKDNRIRINALTLNLDGWLAREKNGLRMDLRLDAPEGSFKELLSMIPYIYRENFAELQTAGQFAFNGTAKGLLDEKSVPTFDLNVSVRDGMFQYPDLPTPVKNVQLALSARNPGGGMDATVIDLSRLHLEILNDPINATARITTPSSDLFLETAISGSMNLDEVKNIFPLKEGVTLSGILKPDFRLKGPLSAIRNNDINRFSTGGTLDFTDVRYHAPDLPQQIGIKSALLEFSPQRAALKNFSASFGESDLQAEGVLEDVFGYVFHDQSIKGTLALRSNKLDLNPWLADDSEPLTPVELPARVEFLMTVDMKTVLFDKLILQNVKSTMQLVDQKLNLLDLRADMLQGSMKSNGSYSYIPPAKPQMLFNLDIAGFNIAESFQKVVTVQKFAPLADKMDGIFSGSLSLNTDLNNQFLPVWQNLNSRGSLEIPKVKIIDATLFNKLSETLKLPALHNPALKDLAPNYTIKDGRFFLEPLAFAIEQYQIQASGSYGIDQSLDYLMKISVPATAFKQQVNSTISQLVKQDLNALSDENILIDVKIGGSYNNPRMEISGAEIVKGLANPLKDAAAAEAERQKAELAKQAQAELEARKKEAEQKLKDKLKGLFKK